MTTHSFFLFLRRNLAPFLRNLLERSAVVRFVGTRLMRLYLRPITEWQGFTVHVDPSDFGVTFELESTGDYEPTTIQFCKDYLKEGMTFIDVGANIGLFSLVASRAVGRGNVYAFEHGEGNFKLLQQNTRENNCSNTRVYRRAVLDRSGTCTLHLGGFNTADHRTYFVSEGRKQEEVVCISIDDFINVQSIQKVDLVKIDVEGVEELVLKGMTKLLDVCPCLIVECWPEQLEAAGTPADRPFKFLHDKGYELSLIDDINGSITPMSYDVIVTESRKRDVANILCRKTSK